MAKFVFAAKDGSGDITDEKTGKVIEFSSQDAAIEWAQKNKVDPEIFDIDEIVPSVEGSSIKAIEEMDSDVKSEDGPPFLQRTPRTSDIIAESTQDGKMGPIAYKRFVEGENELLANTLAAIPEKASSYGGTETLRSGIGNMALGLIAPATAEAYARDRVPGLGEALLDLGLLGASVYATPARGASALGKAAPGVARYIAPGTSAIRNVAVEGATAGAISGLGELGQSELNDRDYMLSAPLLGAGIGGALGGAKTTSQAKKLADMGFSEEEIPDLLARLSTTTERTRKAINPGGKKDFGATEITKYSSLGDALKDKAVKDLSTLDQFRIVGEDAASLENTYQLDKVLSDIAEARKELTRKYIDGMPSDTYKKKLGILQDFEDKVRSRSGFITEREKDYLLGAMERNAKNPATVSALEQRYANVEANPKVLGAGMLNDLQDIADPSIQRQLLESIPRDKQLLAPLLREAKYAQGAERAPSVIESGSLLQTGKNILKAPPHVSKSVQQAARPAARTLSQEGRSTDEDGNLLYAPYGQQTYEWLWEQAPKVKKFVKE